jgi:hypothetical protein
VQLASREQPALVRVRLRLRLRLRLRVRVRLRENCTINT